MLTLFVSGTVNAWQKWKRALHLAFGWSATRAMLLTIGEKIAGEKSYLGDYDQLQMPKGGRASVKMKNALTLFVTSLVCSGERRRTFLGKRCSERQY